MPTDAELLEDARTAYQTALRTGKEVEFNGRRWASHNLADLRTIIADLEQRTGTVTRSRLAAFRNGT